MNNSRIEVTNKFQGHHLLNWTSEVRDVLKFQLDRIEESKFYLLESQELIESSISKEVLSDPVLDIFENENWINAQASFAVEVGFKPGVTDNLSKSVVDAFELFDIKAKVSTGKIYWLFGKLDRKEAEKVSREVLANPLLNSIKVMTVNEYLEKDRFLETTLPSVKIEGAGEVQAVNLELSDKDLAALSIERCLALTTDELHEIKNFYKKEEVAKDRIEAGLPSCPTDVELEVLAQTWSEHCKHKIFAAQIEYKENVEPKYGPKLGSFKVDSLFKECIKDTTEKIKKDRGLDWLISVFSDNAGIVRFDKNVDLCFKAETHNSPSALDPYGGALTGILGVNRDILGCGLGARPIANTDVFCFAPSNLGDHDHGKSLPVGPKPPRRTIEGVHKGVEDGGNKSGVPTVNGAFFFDNNYAGKPLVFCGTVGVMPQRLKDGRTTEGKGQKPGDRIYMVGGAIGADGIHGATFSSLELDENSPATAVQIGDPITQKRVLDFMMEARDRCLFTSVTDNGAGGLSSSVGEMAELPGGAIVNLEKAPTKYPGLKPYELFISESQERMTFSVESSSAREFEKLALEYSVEATDIGEFTDSGSLDIFYGNELCAKIDLDFLHNGLPQMNLKSSWDGELYNRENWAKVDLPVPYNGVINQSQMEEHLEAVLKRPSIASKEEYVRRFDHEVGGATHIKPFGGENGNGPNDSGVIWLGPHGGEMDNAVAIGCGIAPRISLYDTYLMAQFAVDEAFRNIVSSGADPEQVCLLDNFCWPDPIYHKEKNTDGDHKLAQLVRACKGLSDICEAYGSPLVSGKDSMKNDFRGKNGYGEDIKVSVLPTLLISAIGKLNINSSKQTSLKKEGDMLYLLGGIGKGLLGSEFLEITQIQETTLPGIDLEKNFQLYKKIHKGHKDKVFSSLHDISEGGMAVTLSESCFGGELGMNITLPKDSDPLEALFNEAPGRFVVSVDPKDKDRFETLFDEALLLGEVTSESMLRIDFQNRVLINKSTDSLKESWRTPIC
ncbi:MAG: phosphoribosylformylglycinamidine synthase [Bacteriovoracaceae bacterium]|jgi:phosphoribosylformylglycinamidine synthase